jgi:uncharacterized protein YjcR
MAGAPKGNTNALKHGLYAKLYSPEQKADLKKMALDDLAHEINAACVVVSDILKCHYQIMATGQVNIPQRPIPLKQGWE